MYDPDTSVVLHYVEKPESYISNTVNGGVYREYAAGVRFASRVSWKGVRWQV